MALPDHDETPQILDESGNPISVDLDEDALAVPDSDTETSEGGTARPAGSPLLPSVTHGGVSGKKGDLLGYYLAEVRQYPLLEPEEEKELAVRYQESGDADAAHRLVTANLRLVVKLAFQYHRQWSNVLDLIQEGNVGLVEALSRYDPYRGIRFSSYAQYWIRAMILRFLMDNFRMVRLGSTRHGRKLFFQLQKERDNLIAQGIQPSTLALSEALDVPEHEIINVDQHLRAPALSLHAPVGAEEGRSLSEVVSSSDARSPDVEVERGELGSLVAQRLDQFSATLRDEREEAIWLDRLTNQDPVSLAALGERFGVSKERIRQVEARIKARLRDYLADELGDEIAFEFDVPQG